MVPYHLLSIITGTIYLASTHHMKRNCVAACVAVEILAQAGTVRLSVLYLKSSVCDRTGVERACVVSMHQSGTFRIPPKLLSAAMRTVRTDGYSPGARFQYVCASVQTGTAVLAGGLFAGGAYLNNPSRQSLYHRTSCMDRFGIHRYSSKLSRLTGRLSGRLRSRVICP
jgi:hypothetical protein